MTTSDPSLAKRRPRARRGQGELLRQDILRAAEDLLIRKGDADAVSIRAVAEAVGVTPPSIYLHFADKSDLIFHVCQQQWERFDHDLRASVAGIDDPLAWLERIGHAYIRWGLANPEHYRILFMSKPTQVPAHVDKEQVIMAGTFGDALAVVTRAVERGHLRGDPALLTFSVWAAVHGLVSLMIAIPEVPWPPRDAVVDFTVRRALLSATHSV
jgi:AcrR family transcriptional regulator